MRYIVTNGKNTKAVDFSNPIRDSWDFVEALKKMEGGDVAAKVSAVYRAMNLTADATASIPFAVLKGSQEIDTSADWKNTIGIMPKPKELIRLWRLSLFMTNSAYGRVAKTNPVKREIFYVVPDTIKVITDPVTGSIKQFNREIDGIVVQTYKPDDKNLIKFWRHDHTTELLPSDNTEFQAMSQAAGIIYAADWWTKNYFERGAVRPTVLAVKGMVINDKKDELQSSWSRFVRSLGTRLSELAKVINAETMDVKQIGDGLGDIKDSPVYRQAIENIAMAAGMPLSLLLSNSASYATAQTEYASWFRDSITPWAYWMQEVMNDEIFVPRGYRFEFRPEAAEPSQDEEMHRSQAYHQYVISGMLPSVAAQILGIDLPQGMEYADLDKNVIKPDEQPTIAKPQGDAEAVLDEDDDEMPAKAWEEMDNWRRKAVRLAKRGKPVTFEFKTEHMDERHAEIIRKRLQYAATPDEVKSAFEITEEPNDILILADAINRAVNES